MRVYTVHLRRRADPLFTPDRDAVFVPEGFGWAGFAFTWLWALAGGRWLAALFLLAANFALLAAAYFAGLDNFSLLMLQAAWQIFVGLAAGDVQRWSLRRRGYVEAAVVAAASPIAAEHRYFEQRAAATGYRA